MKTCTVDGCAKQVQARGFCSGHYKVVRRGASLDPERCVNCNAEIVGRRGRRYCSDYCKYHAAYLRKRAEKPPKPTVHCLTCSAAFVQVRKDRRFCSRLCGEVHRGNRILTPYAPSVCALPGCGIEFTPDRSTQRCCSEAHGRKFWAIGRYRPYDDKRRDTYHRRRARERSAATGRPVLLSEIRLRDGNRCHLCRKKVPDTVYPHPLSPSLDHVIPLSKGGPHDPDNVRLAHLRCNMVKGDRGGYEQLLLIG